MRRKKPNGHKTNGNPANQPQVAPLTTQNPTMVQGEIDHKQRQKINWALGIAIVFAILTLAGVVMTYQAVQAADRQAAEAAAANKLTQTANDRLSGKLKAHFAFVDDKKATVENSKRFMKTAKTERGEEEVLRIDSYDELIRWGPRVTIKNTGVEIIDSVRIEVDYQLGAAYGPSVSQIFPIPLALKNQSDGELTSFGKLMPQKTMTIWYAPLLLEQMMAADFGKFSDNDRWGRFKVRVLCRIGGASNYDQMESTREMMKYELFHWKPSGFKDEKKVHEIVKMKPYVTLH